MSDRSITRVRHAAGLRLLDVVATTLVTPHLVRVMLGGEQLAGFTSLGFDDHVKVFIPPEGEAFDSLPVLGPGGPVFKAGAPTPALRDYTPHHFDPVASMLQLDFALHDAGPATAWALRAQKSDKLIIGGPRGSFVVGTGFDWHLLMGDATALPAIRRRLAELPEGSHAVVFAEMGGPEDKEPFTSRANVEIHWLYRTCQDDRSATCLLQAATAASFPDGDYYAWIACESADAKAIRAALLGRGADRASLKASGYWRRGAAATHDAYD